MKENVGSRILAALKNGAKKIPGLWSGLLSYLSDLWKKIWNVPKEYWKKFRSEPAEKRKMIAAALTGTAAIMLLSVALIVGLTFRSKTTGKRSVFLRAVAESEETDPDATPLPVSEEELGPTEEWEDNESVPNPEATPEPMVLRKHDASSDVMELQKRLIELGYLEIDEPTDYYGSSTEYAVTLFQRQHGLESDGVAGAQTLSLLYSKDAQKSMLKEGAEGRDVKMLQEQLVDLGYLDSKDVDSVYGEVTQTAVMAFQKRNRLTADGKAGEKTLAILYSDDAKMSEEMAAKVKAEEEAAAKKAKEEEEKAEKKAKEESAKERKARKEAEAKATREKKIDKFIKAAQSKIGCEYILGDKGPDTFDCSGFVWYCLKQAGVSTTRLNAAGYSKKSSWKEITKLSACQRGDILFFKSDNSKSVSHTGIYLGNGTMIDASSGNGKVVKRSLSAYWKRNFVNARRPW
jgi:peptidoglycan hydrolase-like protein with peptidoglycan-binding domain